MNKQDHNIVRYSAKIRRPSYSELHARNVDEHGFRDQLQFLKSLMNYDKYDRRNHSSLLSLNRRVKLWKRSNFWGKRTIFY